MWMIFSLLPAKHGHLIPLFSEIVTHAGIRRSGGGFRRQLVHLNELIRLIGTITPAPFG